MSVRLVRPGVGLVVTPSETGVGARPSFRPAGAVPFLRPPHGPVELGTVVEETRGLRLRPGPGAALVPFPEMATARQAPVDAAAALDPAPRTDAGRVGADTPQAGGPTATEATRDPATLGDDVGLLVGVGAVDKETPTVLALRVLPGPQVVDEVRPGTQRLGTLDAIGAGVVWATSAALGRLATVPAHTGVDAAVLATPQVAVGDAVPVVRGAPPPSPPRP